MSFFTFEREMENEWLGIPTLPEREELADEEVAAAERWLLRAAPGSSRVYHEGQLAVDRLTNPLAARIGALMGWAAMVGLVVLTQKRTEPLTYGPEGQVPHERESVFVYTAHRTSVVWEMPMPAFDAKGRWRYCGNSEVMGLADGGEG